MSCPIGRAVIVGGGIGGLTAAIALRQVGVEVAVYEQAPRLNAVGAGLTVWSNAIKALRRLGVADAVIRTGSKIQAAELRTSTGRTLSRSHPGEIEERFGEPTVAIHRADLHDILLAALPENLLQLGATCVALEQDATGVTVHFADGRTDRADLLIGADGIHSTVRRQIFPAVPLRYSGYTAWRGVVATEDEAALGTTSESWGCGARFGILRIDERRVYWFATANMPAGVRHDVAERRDYLLGRFRGWHRPIESLIESTPAAEILHNDIYDIKPMKSWSKGRVVLLGDAAHPTTPNMGQGACMAIESSLVLARCLAEGPELTAALRRYEALRMPRTSWITEQSWKIGRIGQLENRLACLVRDWLVGLTPASVSKKQFERAAAFEV